MEDSAEAAYRSALAQLADPRTRDIFEAGVAGLESAAAKGHAEATAMVATLEAIGAGRPQSWARAFDTLARAAGLGSTAALAQLRLLADLDDPESPAEALRPRIDLAALLRVPEREALSETPRLRAFRGFARPAECRWVIDRLRAKLGPAMIWDEVSGRGRIDPGRSNRALELRLAEMDVVTELLRARISAATGLPEAIFEVPQLMHYAVGQEFTPHHDFLDPGQPGPRADIARRGQRMGTFLIYLNEEFEGGETDFPRAALSFRGRTGDALFFANVGRDGRPDPLTIHAGRPPVTGEKWIFSQWIRDRPPSS